MGCNVKKHSSTFLFARRKYFKILIDNIESSELLANINLYSSKLSTIPSEIKITFVLFVFKLFKFK